MNDEDRRAPEPQEDKAILVRDEDGGVRVVPGGNIVEGELEEDVSPSCPLPEREGPGGG